MVYVEKLRLQARKMAVLANEKAPFSAIFPLCIQGAGQRGPAAVKENVRQPIGPDGVRTWLIAKWVFHLNGHLTSALNSRRITGAFAPVLPLCDRGGDRTRSDVQRLRIGREERASGRRLELDPLSIRVW
jgi:hypothetical protein